MKGTVPLVFAIFICSSYIQGEIQIITNESEICSQIGIEENAVLNRCGFCTEGDTGLDSNYGFDCNHVCNGQSYLDCNNQCNGNSFIDVCTGLCIKPKDNLTFYERRDCRGMCQNSQSDSDKYKKNDCDLCQLHCSQSQNEVCNSGCPSNQTEIVCENDIEINEKNDNYCYDFCKNNTIDCLCRLDPSVCHCNTSNDCYYISSIDPNVVPTHTLIDINVYGYFNVSSPSIIHCVLTDPNEGNELLFEAKLLNSSSIECKVNLTQAGQYLFGLQSNQSKNILNLSVYDRDLDMKPKKFLTTDSNKTIELTFDLNPEIAINLKALLKCKLIYNSKQIVIKSNVGNSCTIPSSESHSNSQKVVVIPTFDGIHSVSNPLNFSLYLISPFPRVVNELSFISEDSLNIIVVFERPIDIFVPKTMFAQEVCDHYFTNSTLNRLKAFELNHCKWLTKTQFFISLNHPIDVNFIEISFKEQTIKELLQKIRESNTRDLEIIVKKKEISPYFYDSEPQLILRGPTLLPVCGPFSLNAYLYSRKGSTNVVFKWSVTTLPLRNLLISDKLFNIIDSNNKTSLLLFGQMFSLEAISYKLTISAIFDDKTVIEASHQMLRSSEQLPIVSIFATPQPNQHTLISHISQTLYSEVLIPKCIASPEPLTYSWKTNNPEMKFNFENRTSAEYQIDYSKPLRQMTTFEINVQIGNQSSMSTASLTLYPFLPQNIINTNQISKLSIGRKSGKFKLSAPLLDPLLSNTTGFLWSCHYSGSRQPCHLNSNPKQLLISRDIQNKRELSLNSETMRISEHKFDLRVIDTKDNSSQLLNPFTTVRVFEGNAPQVFIDSIYVRVDDNKIGLLFNNNQSNIISVPSMTRLVVRGVIRKSSQFDSIEWHLSQSITQLNWNKINTKYGIISELHLYPDQIFPFGSYNISLMACNDKKVCSQVERQLMAGPVVNQCVVTTEQNLEMFEVAFITDRCNIPMNRLPLTYQLFVTKNDNQMIPLSGVQYSSVIVYNYYELISSENTFSVEVCDGYAFCQMINATNHLNLKSTKFQNNSQTIDELIERSQEYVKFDPISSLILLMSPLINSSDQQFIHKLKADYLRQISAEDIKRKGQLIVIYNTFMQIFDETKDFRVKYDLIRSLKQISDNTRISVDINTLDALYTNLLNSYIFEDRIYNQINESFGYYEQISENEKKSYLSDVRHILANILKLCAKQIMVGKYVKLGTRVQFPKAVTLITHQKNFKEISFTTKLNEWKNVSVFLKFNEFDRRIYKLYNRLTQNSQNIVYNSVVYALTLFPNNGPYLIGDKMHKLSPIVGISVYYPDSGQQLDTEFKVKKEIKYEYIAHIKVSLTGNETYGGSSYTMKCHYFNENTRNWELDGITEWGISGSRTGCFLAHLTTMAVFRVVFHISSDYIFGVLVAVLMGVLIFGIMVVFFVQKKEQTVTISSNQRNSYSNTYLNSHKSSFDDNYTKTYIY